MPPGPLRFAGTVCLSLGLIVSQTPAAGQPLSRPDSARPNVSLRAADAPSHDPEALSPLAPGIRSWGVGAVHEPRRGTIPRIGPSGDDSLVSEGGIAALGATSKISGTPMVGSVTAFRVSPDGATAVFIADKETAGRFELYSCLLYTSPSPRDS